MLTRREFSRGLGAGLWAGAGVGVGASLLGGPVWAARDMQIGQAVLTSVSDGNLVLPGAFFFDDLPADELAPILQEAGVGRDEVRPPCNVTLLRDGERVILFDVGSGSGFMPSAGALVDSLDALGVAPEDVTHVIFTHAHPDHLWGVLDDFDDPLFYEAEHMIGKAEWDYWMDPQTVDTIGEARASFAVGAQRRLAAMEDQMRFITDGEEVLPGVAAVASYGHTPGHLAFEVRQGTEAVLVGGDAIGNHHIALARPDWQSGSDQDPEQGVATRKALLDRLATEQMPILGFHLPGGGLGRIEKSADGYRFIAGDL